MSVAAFMIVTHLLAAGLAGTVAWLTARHRRIPGARSFAVAMAAVACWSVLGAAEWVPAFGTPVRYTLALRLDWLPIGVLAVAWLAFALAYTGRGEQVTRRRVVGLSVIPAFTAFAALCHPLLIPEYAALLGPFDGATAALWAVEGAWGTLEALGVGYTYLLLGVGSLFLLELLVERPAPHAGQLLVAFVVLPPWVLNATHLFVVRFEAFDPTVLGFTVSGVAGLFAVGRFRLFDVPLARARVVETLDEGIVVYSRDGRVYDYNDRAAALLGLGPGSVGRDIRTVLADGPLDLPLPTGVTPFGSERSDGESEESPEEAGDGSPEEAGDGSPEETGSGPPDEPASGPPDETGDGLPGDAGGGSPPERPGRGRLVDGGVRSLADHLDHRTVAVEDGSATHVETRVSDLPDVVGRPLGRVVVLYDVSERERRERELERKNEFLDGFAGVVSHDIATPLGVIENRARLVEMTGDPSHAAEIFEATERIHGMVDQLRELARQGEQVGEREPVDLGTVTREAWGTVEAADASLTVEASTTVEADRQRLRQLLENLLRNSVEHGSSGREGADDGTGAESTDDGTGAESADDSGVTIRVGPTADGFYVADDGPGIPDSDRQNVFEQGYTTGSDSTGLGLAIVRRIAEGHGWRVDVTGSEAGGARFEVTTGGRGGAV